MSREINCDARPSLTFSIKLLRLWAFVLFTWRVSAQFNSELFTVSVDSLIRYFYHLPEKLLNSHGNLFRTQFPSTDVKRNNKLVERKYSRRSLNSFFPIPAQPIDKVIPHHVKPSLTIKNVNTCSCSFCSWRYCKRIFLWKQKVFR